MLKGAGGIFLCWTGLIAVVCVPSFIAGVTYTKPGRPVTLLNATVTGPENNIYSQSDTVDPNTAPDRAEQPDQWQTVRMHVTADCPCPGCAPYTP